jgi:hypothetical protein
VKFCCIAVRISSRPAGAEAEAEKVHATAAKIDKMGVRQDHDFVFTIEPFQFKEINQYDDPGRRRVFTRSA